MCLLEDKQCALTADGVGGNVEQQQVKCVGRLGQHR
jgi:hypothetical protein